MSDATTSFNAIVPWAEGRNRSAVTSEPCGSATPVLAINLARSSRRVIHLQAEMDAAGLPLQRLIATDGATMPDAMRARHYSDTLNRQSYHKPLLNGEIGCYISHLRAWQWLLDSGFEHAIILEDDVTLGATFCDALSALSRLPMAWDIIKLGSLSPKPVLDSVNLGQFSLRRYRKTPISAFAQAISRRGAEKLLRTRTNFGRPVDVDIQYCWEAGLEIYGLEPYPVRIRQDVPSDISRIAERDIIRRRRITFLRQRLQFVFRQIQANRNWSGWPQPA